MGKPTVSLEIWHVAIPVTDLDRSLKFYCGGLGLHLVGRDAYSDKKRAFIVTQPGGFSIELFQVVGETAGLPPKRPDHLAFECADLEKFRGTLVDRGFSGLAEIDEFDNGVKYLPLLDPDGTLIELFQGRTLYEASIRP